MDTEPLDGLEIESDPNYQRWEWRCERAGWIVWLGIIAAAFWGMLGTGYTSRRYAQSDDGSINIEYQGVLRTRQPGEVHVILKPTSSKGSARLHVGRQFTKAIQIQRIVPEPTQSVAGSDGTYFDFAIEGNEGEIVMHIEPDHASHVSADFRSETASVPFDAYILP